MLVSTPIPKIVHQTWKTYDLPDVTIENNNSGYFGGGMWANQSYELILSGVSATPFLPSSINARSPDSPVLARPACSSF